MNLKSIYTQLEADRHCFLQRAYRSAVFTIPSILPEEGTTRDALPQNYQSIGARGVNNLASKLKLTLFPTQLPFFRLELDPFAARAISAIAKERGEGADTEAEILAEIEKNLGLIEETVQVKFQGDGWGPVVAQALRHLVVTGNGCIADDPDRGPKFIDLRHYVVELDPEGNLLRVVYRQRVAEEVIKERMGEDWLASQTSTDNPNGTASAATKVYFLYTGAILTSDGKFDYWQEIEDAEVPGTRARYKRERLPIIPLRFTAVSNENYGAGYVEEYDGDLLTLESLSRAVTEASLAASKLLTLVRPGSHTRIAQIAKAPNGAIIPGAAEDITFLNVQKQGDLAVANQRIAIIEQRLAYAFLLFSSVQRQAERVTAEEIRLAAQELEDVLGNVYTDLAVTVQAPIVNYLLEQVKRRKDIPEIPPEVRVQVATGLEAIARGHMAIRLQQFGAVMVPIVGPEATARAINEAALAKVLCTALGINSNEILRTKEEIAQLQAQQSEQALVEKLGPNFINAAAAQPAQ